MGRRRKKGAQLIFLRFKETVLNVYHLGPTFHPMSPSPIVKLFFLMGIVYMVENIPNDFPSLVGDFMYNNISCAAEVKSASCALAPICSQNRFWLLFKYWDISYSKG